MASVTTYAATNITATSARLNGYVDGIDYQCGFDGDVGYIDLGSQGGSFYYDISGLSPGVTYGFAAWYDDGSGAVYGDTLYFHTPGTTPKGISGTLHLSGNLGKYKIHTPTTSYVNKSGTLRLSGGLVRSTQVTEGGELQLSGTVDARATKLQAVDGTLSLSGSLSTAGVTYEQSADGTLQFSGALTPSSVSEVSVGGTLNLSGDVDTVKAVVTATGDRNVAATKNLFIEQGVTYVKTFEWRNSSGVAHDLSFYSLRMAIKAYKGASSSIATSASTITLAKLESTGQFQISIPAGTTDDFTFTRAFYDIEAVYGAQVYRLLEGIVYLSKEVTTIE